MCMSRSAWKGCFLNIDLKKRVKIWRDKGFTRKFKLWSRDSVISSNFIGIKVLVHNGRIFKNFSVTREHIGYKFGYFVLTRKFTVKSKIKQIKKSTIKKK